MIHYSNINKTKLYLLICLESIKIENNNKIFYNTYKEFKNSTNINYYNNLSKRSKLSHIKNLSLINKILNKTQNKYEKIKIISILKYYSKII